MNYIDKTPKGLVTSKNVVKLYDIVQPRKGFWKDKLAIITDVKNDMIYCRIIENGMDMIYRIKDITFVNHNNKTAAKSYFELCEKMKAAFIAKYSDIDYIKENFDTDKMIVNDITARTICQAADIYISSNPDRYSALAVNWLAKNKELISAIIRLGDRDIVEKLHDSEIRDCGLTNYIRLCNYLYGKS